MHRAITLIADNRKEFMRKFIILVALAALGILATAAVASASVVVNSDGTISVGKGDVQNALGLKNDAALQDYVVAKGVTGVTFTDKSVTTWHFVNRCNGTDYIHDIISTSERPITVQAHTNAQGKISSGWTLTPGTLTTSTKYNNYSNFTAYLMCKYFGGIDEGNSGSTVTTTGGLQVDGHDLRITPLV